MIPSVVLELNAFVPAKDHGLSKQFYLDLGFMLRWSNDDIAQFQIGTCTFLLQKFHVQQHAENFMMALMVEDADVWWTHIEHIGLREKYPHIMLKPPALQPWGLRVLYFSLTHPVSCGTSRIAGQCSTRMTGAQERAELTLDPQDAIAQ